MFDTQHLMEKQPIIEGKEPSQDLSYQWVEQNEDIKTIEKGIPILEFEHEASMRNLEMEYRVNIFIPEEHFFLNEILRSIEEKKKFYF